MQSLSPLHHADSDAAFAHYDQRIRTLTHLLDKHAAGTPLSNLDPEDPDANEELRFFYNLATLLTTGSHDQNCAVTAVLLPGLVKCIIVDTGGTRHGRSSSSVKHETHVHLVREGRINMTDLASGS